MVSLPLKEKHTPLRLEELEGLSARQQRQRLLERMASSVEGRKRFWDKVDIKSANECWPWKGWCRRNKYGVYGILVGGASRSFDTHRVAYYLANGEIPEGMCVCHSCDNPPCCNPNHFFLGTQTDNMSDMVKKGRNIKGEKVNFAKLKAPQVIGIRELYRKGHTQEHIGSLYKTSRVNVCRIVNYMSWKHLP